MSSHRLLNHLLVIAAILSLLLAQCSLSPAPTATPAATPAAAGPVRGGVFTMAFAADASTLQPLVALDSMSLWFSGYIYDSLLRRERGLFVPNMAESFEFSEDGLTLSMRLKHDLTWSDGTLLTAADVLFTYQTKHDLPASQTLRNTFTSVEAADPYTIVFHLPAPNCMALFEASLTILPKHIFEGADINNNPHNTKPTVSSGPFILQEWAKDDHLTLVANDRFHRGRPNLDKLVIRIVKDLTVASALLKTQEIDYASVLPADWETLNKTSFLSTLEMYTTGVSSVFLVLNHAHPALKDVRVRQAFAYALDKQSMANAAYEGHAHPLSGMVLPAHWAYTGDLASYDHNTATASALMKEAGWTAGADGILVKDGKPLKLRLHYIPSVKQYEQIAIITQDQLRRIGVAVEAIAEEWGAMINRWTKTTDYDLIVGAYGSSDPHDTLRIYTTGSYVSGYSNPEIDRLWAEGAVVPGCRTEIARRSMPKRSAFSARTCRSFPCSSTRV